MATPSNYITGSLLELIDEYEVVIDEDMALNYDGGAIYETNLSGTVITGSVVIGELRRRYMVAGDASDFRWTDVQIIAGDGTTFIKMRNRNFPYVRS
jgi:hypothetical protein